MKRSHINSIIEEAKGFFAERGFRLPPWALWAPSEWKGRRDSCYEIIDNMLGWDVTPFSSDDFHRRGLLAFTLRNGNLKRDKKTYGEKILIVEEDQVTPLHFHWSKMEDIINRGGGDLAVKLYNATADESLADTDVTVQLDGVTRTVKAGDTVVLGPGESITLEPYCYHEFRAVGERALIGEVSKVNDDNTDNRFLDGVGRFPDIEEDEPPLHLLVNDYERYYGRGE